MIVEYTQNRFSKKFPNIYMKNMKEYKACICNKKYIIILSCIDTSTHVVFPLLFSTPSLKIENEIPRLSTSLPSSQNCKLNAYPLLLCTLIMKLKINTSPLISFPLLYPLTC